MYLFLSRLSYSDYAIEKLRYAGNPLHQKFSGVEISVKKYLKTQFNVVHINSHIYWLLLINTKHKKLLSLKHNKQRRKIHLHNHSLLVGENWGPRIYIFSLIHLIVFTFDNDRPLSKLRWMTQWCWFRAISFA